MKIVAECPAGHRVEARTDTWAEVWWARRTLRRFGRKHNGCVDCVLEQLLDEEEAYFRAEAGVETARPDSPRLNRLRARLARKPETARSERLQ